MITSVAALLVATGVAVLLALAQVQGTWNVAGFTWSN
jgi:hypothetical protein